MILYFSGTGNSKYIAQKIKEALDDPIFCINDAIKYNDKNDLFTGTRVIIVTPTYAWRMPRIVQNWLEQVTLVCAEKVWFVMDCGSEIGNAAKYNRKLALKKNLNYMGTVQIKMPENYIAMFKTPSEQDSKITIGLADNAIANVTETIKNGKAFTAPSTNSFDKLLSGIVNILFYPTCVKTKKFIVKESCVGCQECVQLCPLNNITIKNGKPVWGKNCTHCMACISYCPKEAIEYGSHSVGLRRYHI